MTPSDARGETAAEPLNQIDEKERRAYQFVQNLLQKTQDQLLMQSTVNTGANNMNSATGGPNIPLDYEINLNLKTLTNYQLKLQLKAEEAISELAESTQ